MSIMRHVSHCLPFPNCTEERQQHNRDNSFNVVAIVETIDDEAPL